jgi:hypothetical protein
MDHWGVSCKRRIGELVACESFACLYHLSWNMLESFFVAQITWSSKKAYSRSRCCFWHGISAFERYHSFWFEVRQFACQFKGSPTPHMQGNVCRNLSLLTPYSLLLPLFYCLLLVLILYQSMLFNFQKSFFQLYSLYISLIHTCNSPVLQVGDFGLSKIKRNTLVSGGVRGTLPWMAPELLDGTSNRVSEKVSTVLV